MLFEENRRKALREIVAVVESWGKSDLLDQRKETAAQKIPSGGSHRIDRSKFPVQSSRLGLVHCTMLPVFDLHQDRLSGTTAAN